jgi:hypothetical protein
VYVASCEEGTTVVVCENFTCPCSLRRLLQVSEPSTKVNVVYTQVQETTNQTQILRALEQAYQKPVLVISTTSVQLPSSTVVWNPDIIFYIPMISGESFPIGIVLGGLGAAIVIALLVTLMVYCSTVAKASPLPTQTTTTKTGRLLNVKIRFD